jgi:uncharacterized membrane protein YsdA (DUF1294 family)
MPNHDLAHLLAAAIAYNLFVFGVYAWDKRAAATDGWRVRERTLIALAVAGGGAGAFLCQRLFRHKTRKPPFRLLLPILFGLQTAAMLMVLPSVAKALAACRLVAGFWAGG